MPKRDIPIPIIPEDEMYTEDGFPSAKLLETHYRYMMQKYGPMEIVHRGRSAADVLAECGIIDADDEPQADDASKDSGGS